ncbi:hypothetical protein HNR46_002070 [Haloferula luteola]|uniref:Uncharacterized protein n=1 Tax=Haloferula luteola TaxID=595692 RepID=A0A840VGB2_9BACT|nr:hypothetical protein [Haloferula luteola]MBB5351831.1 hypothetical protein [Haloferula luteola]
MADEPSRVQPKAHRHPNTPPAALLTADSLPPGNRRDRLLQQGLQAWSSKSPLEAIAWVENRPDSEERATLLLAIEAAISQRQPTHDLSLGIVDQVAEAVERLSIDDSAISEVEALTEKWARTDLPSAAAWAIDQPDSEIRDHLIQRIALVRAHDNPMLAAQWVVEQIPQGAQQDEAILTVVNRWGMGDPSEAALWVETFADGPLKERAQKELQGIRQYRSTPSASSLSPTPATPPSVQTP